MKNFIGITLIILLSHYANCQQLIIQPDTDTGNDSYIWSRGLTSNYGKMESLFTYTWTHQGGLANVRSLIKFDLNNIPEGSNIDEALLSLYWNPTETTNGVSEHSGENEFWIERIISPWHEDVVNWENQPQTTQQNRVLLPISANENQDYIDIDITNLVNDMLLNPNESYGFMLKMVDENSPYKNVVFASSENPNSDIRPSLKINYSDPKDNCLKIRPNSNDGQDSYIWSIGTTNNYSDNQSIHSYTWTNSGNLGIIRGLLSFDLKDIPSNVTIDDAKLSLFYHPNSPFQGTNIHSMNNEFWLERTTDSWTEELVTWANQPSTTTENRVEVASSLYDNQDYLDIDVTKLLIDNIATQSQNLGMMLKMQNESDPFRNVIFASSNHVNKTYHPLLEVCWSILSNDITIDTANEIIMFPNPAHEIINFENVPNNYVSFSIKNTSGVKIKSAPIKNNAEHFSINISTLNNGSYLIDFRTNKGELKTYKFIKI